jgi:predicted nucleotidyltransferase
MRITAYQHQVILAATREFFGERALVRLFGSRMDDTQRGGDIDLWVETPQLEPLKAKKSLQLSSAIARQLGDCIEVDVIVKDAATQVCLIHQEGMKGVLL